MFLEGSTGCLVIKQKNMWEAIESPWSEEDRYKAPERYDGEYFSNAFQGLLEEMNSVLNEQDEKIELMKKKITKMNQIYKIVEQTNILLSSLINRQALSSSIKWWETNLLLNEVRDWMAKILQQTQEDIW